MIEYWVGLSTPDREISANNYQPKKTKFDIAKREDGTAFIFNVTRLKFETEHCDWGWVSHIILTEDTGIFCYGIKLLSKIYCGPYHTLRFAKGDISLTCDKKYII